MSSALFDFNFARMWLKRSKPRVVRNAKVEACGLQLLNAFFRVSGFKIRRVAEWRVTERGFIRIIAH